MNKYRIFTLNLQGNSNVNTYGGMMCCRIPYIGGETSFLRARLVEIRNGPAYFSDVCCPAKTVKRIRLTQRALFMI